MTTPLTTPRRPFAAAASAALGSTAPAALGPGGCPYEVTVPKWAQRKDEEEKDTVFHMEHHPPVVFVLGGPGAGKGTQCRRIVEEFAYEHFSMGDLLRQERNNLDSELGQLVNQHIMQGTLVPDELTVKVLLKAMEGVEDWKHSKFLIDGFPRTVEQMKVFNKIVGPKVVVKCCLYFDCSEATAHKRLLAHSETEWARDDDNDDVIKKRVKNFRKDMLSIPKYFQYEGLLERVDANRDIEKVWHDVQQFFVVESYHDQSGNDPHSSSPSKAIWKLRDKQSEEMFPTSHSHTSVASTKAAHARNFTSYQILARHRDKHTRNMRSPTDHFNEPQTLAHEIGWHHTGQDESIGAKGTPRGMTTPRAFYPKSTCAMTRHLENMYSTNAQHIIRRW